MIQWLLGSFLLLASMANANSVDLEGDLSATAVTVEVDKTIVSGWLPDGMTMESAQTHVPVVVFLGDQNNLRLGAPLAFGRHYREVIVAVPHVSYEGKTYLYFPRLYLDNAQAVSWGVAAYGFPKLMGYLESSPDRYLAMDERQENTFLEFQFSPTASDISLSHPNFVDFRELLNEDMLLVKNGRIRCTVFALEWASATYASVRARGSLFAPFMSALRDTEVVSGGIHEQPLGALQFNAHWRVPPVHSCR